VSHGEVLQGLAAGDGIAKPTRLQTPTRPGVARCVAVLHGSLAATVRTGGLLSATARGLATQVLNRETEFGQQGAHFVDSGLTFIFLGFLNLALNICLLGQQFLEGAQENLLVCG